MKFNELSVELQHLIVRGYRSGEGYKIIYGVLKVPKSTVSSIIRKWKEDGTTKTLPRADSPTKLSNRARRTLVREVTKNPMTTLTELQSSFAKIGEPAGRTTVSAAFQISFVFGLV